MNVLIALHDPAHPGHEKAHSWLTEEGQIAWATCPLTENGFVRVLSQPQYPNNVGSVAAALAILENMLTTHVSGHHFWHDSLSLANKALFRASSIAGSKQITDVYLLGLCQQNGGTLVTLDGRVTTVAVTAPYSDLLRIL